MRTVVEGIVFAGGFLAVLCLGFLLLPKPAPPAPHVNFPDAPMTKPILTIVPSGSQTGAVFFPHNDYQIGRYEAYRVSGKPFGGFYLVFDTDTSESVSPWDLLEMKREVARIRTDVGRLTILTSATVPPMGGEVFVSGSLILQSPWWPYRKQDHTELPGRVDPQIFLEGLK